MPDNLVNVLKAGGTSVGTPEAMKIVRDETLRIHYSAVKEYPNAVTIMVPSATGKQKEDSIKHKNTDLLEKILKGENVQRCKDEVFSREERIVSYFGLPKDFNRRNFGLLDHYLKESGVSPDERYSKVVTIVGEMLKAGQFAAIFNLIKDGVAIHIDYDKSGVTTTNGLRNATKTSSTYNDIKNALSKPEYYGKILVIGGFMGIDKDTGKVTTLERGGSDTHAVWLGCALGAKQVYIYSDTSLRRANPNIVPNAEIITKVTYGEMAEFIGFGSQLLAYRANEAARENLVESILKDTFHLDYQTLVSANHNNSYGVVKGIAACPSVVMALDNLQDVPGAHNKATAILLKYGIGFVNEAGDTRSSSMVLTGTPENPLEKNIGYAMKELDDLGLEVNVNYSRTRIGLIGEEIGKSPKGLVAIGQTLDSLHLPVNSISLPESGRALSIITDKTIVPDVIRDLYSRLFGSNSV